MIGKWVPITIITCHLSRNMNKVPNLERRKSRPQTLGGAFGGLMRMFGRAASDSDLVANWERIVGSELAAQATIVGISKIAKGKIAKGGRKLAVRAVVPAMATTLAYRTEEIRGKVNKYYGYDAVVTVKVKK